MLKPYPKNPEYLVSDKGYVMSKNTKKKLKPYLSDNGYNIVSIIIDNRPVNRGVHIIVMETFEPNHLEEKDQVNHIDGNKNNNSLINLEWTTRQENIDHSKEVLGTYKSKGEHVNARKIKATSVTDPTDYIIFNSLIEGAEYFDRHEEYDPNTLVRSIIDAAKGKRKTWRGFKWEYID